MGNGNELAWFVMSGVLGCFAELGLGGEGGGGLGVYRGFGFGCVGFFWGWEGRGGREGERGRLGGGDEGVRVCLGRVILGGGGGEGDFGGGC